MKLFIYSLVLLAIFSCKNKSSITIANTNLDSAFEHRMAGKRWQLIKQNDYWDLKEFSEGLAAFNKDSINGVIDTFGNVIFSRKDLQSISKYSHGYAVVTFREDGDEFQNQAYIDRKGKIVFDASKNGYTIMEPFDQFGHALVYNDSAKYGILNLRFKPIIMPLYEDMTILNANRFQVTKNDKVGVIDSLQNIIIPLLYDQINIYQNENRMFCLKDSAWGIYDTIGKKITSLDCDEIWYNEGMAVLSRMTKKNNYEYALSDSFGKIIIPYGKYDDYYTFSDGIGMVYNETDSIGGVKKYKKTVGFIDKTGQLVIPLQYEGGFSFSEGLAAILKNGRWGYIDKKGNIAIPFKYEKAYPFANGYAEVTQNGEYYVIDREGKIFLKM